MTTLPVDEKKAAYGVIGKNPLRHDGTDKVTGRAQYGADIRLPGADRLDRRGCRADREWPR